METPTIYIPMDRRQAMARGDELPAQTHGAALFADISGFTPLTEALARTLGPQRGAEELTRYLNIVYDALVAEVDRYGGTVIGFSGDAITCWLDGDDGLRATTCSLAMQQAMQKFTALPVPGGGTVALAMKAAVAVGSVRRFVVGDPNILVTDVMAGKTLEHLAAAEHQANKGDVVLDSAAAAALGDRARIVEWRTDEHDGAHYAVVNGLTVLAEPTPWPVLAADALSDDQVRPWVLPPVYARARSGQGEFLAELRPTVALFMRFSGIDYEKDDAAQRLDAYIRWVLGILARYEGYLIQLTVGDKGSYLYAAFGAPIAHGDDPRRAAAAALELQSPPPELRYINPVQIGITRGRMRTGPYGGPTRRSYGVLGDATNLSARLMQNAAPGQILVTEAIAEATDDWFALDKLPPIKVKGKTDPIQIYALVGQKAQQAAELQEVAYSLPMVGRTEELAVIKARLEDVGQGRGQVIGITAEAGMGKSRLVAEVIRLAQRQEFEGYAGAAQSYGTNDSYLVWEAIWQAFFGVDPQGPVDEAIDRLQAQLEALDPALLPRLPLLGLPLNIAIPDNDLTRSFDAKLRKASTEALLVDILRARARGGGTSPRPSPAGRGGQSRSATPLLFVLEDAQWMDPLSHDLLETIGRAIFDVPVLIVMAYRPPEAERLQAPRVSTLPHFTLIELGDFTPEEAARLIRLKLEQLTGADAEVPAGFVDRLTSRAEGNPFYIEELLNYLHDKGIAPQDTKALEALDLPTSLQSLILSRIDQLAESQKITLKVASVIGRQFYFRWLWGVYPELGDPDYVRADLEHLSTLELTPLDQPDPDLAYIFKHIVTREVAYDSLLSSARSLFHGQLGVFIEETYANSLEQHLDLLAFHFERSPHEAKKRVYLRRAGEAAQAAYANETAIDYYRRLLPLLADDEQIPVLLKLGQVLELVSEWGEAYSLYREVIDRATQLSDERARAQAESATGGLLMKQKRYVDAMPWLSRAQTAFQAIGDTAGVADVVAEMGEAYRLKGDYPQAQSYYEESLGLAETIGATEARKAVRAKALKGFGTLAAQQGDYDSGRSRYEESLQLRDELNDKPGVAALLNNLGIIARFQGDYANARTRYEASLSLLRELGDRWSMGQTLNNLGLAARYMDDTDAARRFLSQSLEIQRQLGDRWGIANVLSSLGDVVIDQADYEAARMYLLESLKLNRELGDRRAMAFALEYLSGLASAEQDFRRALCLAGVASGLRETIGAPLTAAEQRRLERRLDTARRTFDELEAQRLWDEGREMPLEFALTYALEEPEMASAD